MDKRNFPSLSELLESPQIKGLVRTMNHSAVVTRARGFLDDLRVELQKRAPDLRDVKLPGIAEIADLIARRILSGEPSPARLVINATGVLMPAALGGAPLADEALAEVAASCRDYSSLGLDIGTGEARPAGHVAERLLCELTGAEAALAVNTPAAALLLVLAALGKSGEIVVARGEVVELEGGYRLAELARLAGARLREVGAANVVREEDYASALGEGVAAILRVDTVTSGHATHAPVPLERLAAVAHARNVPLVHSPTRATLVEVGSLGIQGIPVVCESIRQGASLVCFAGDRLVGGPECGLLVGQRSLIAQLAAHSLAPALAVSRLTLAALEATLRLLRDPAEARRSLPILRLLDTSVENLRHRAQRLAQQIAANPTIRAAEVVERQATLYDGPALPMAVPTCCVAIEPASGTAAALAEKLRAGQTSVLGTVEGSRVLLDLRSVFPRHDAALVEAVHQLAGGEQPPA